MADPRVMLDAIKERADRATPGPWEAGGMDSGHSRYSQDCWVVTADVGDTVCDMNGLARVGSNERYRDEGVADAAFIAAARTYVPHLVAALEAVLDMCLNPYHTTQDADDFACDIGDAIAAALAGES